MTLNSVHKGVYTDLISKKEPCRREVLYFLDIYHEC